MSHTALIALWSEGQIWSDENQGPPPPLDALVELAAERIAAAESAAKHLEPPTLSGYMMTTGDGYRTIGDDISHMKWIAERWTLALACPDERPPLYWQLVSLANDDAPWLCDDEARWISQVWRDHPSPIGEMICRAWRAPTPWPGRIEGTNGRHYPAQHDQAALAWWLANANEVEREHCRQRMPFGAFDALEAGAQ